MQPRLYISIISYARCTQNSRTASCSQPACESNEICVSCERETHRKRSFTPPWSSIHLLYLNFLLLFIVRLGYLLTLAIIMNGGCCTNKIIDIKQHKTMNHATLNGTRSKSKEEYYSSCDAAGKNEENQSAARPTPRVRNLLSRCALSATRKLIQTKEVKLTHLLHLKLIFSRIYILASGFERKKLLWCAFMKRLLCFYLEMRTNEANAQTKIINYSTTLGNLSAISLYMKSLLTSKY